ncbi:MAG TPA: prolyl oligopeptidase family serine peptidase [Vicinamibacterales bacterium]|nr:prolyl oligopeptidase family serine peptidase [Vicinamibacterales bacterium]
MRTGTVATVVALAAGIAGLHAQGAGPQPSGYMTPPKAIVDIMEAAPLPTVSISPARDVIALSTRASMPSIAEVTQPMLRLAGMRIDPRNNGPHRAGGATGVTLRTVATGAEKKISLPAGARIGALSFSPNGKRIAFTNSRDTGIDLYIADVATAQARIVPGAAINGLNGGCEWLDDSASLLCGFVPRPRAAPPAVPKAPTGPNIQESYGKPGPVRTYQDLLTSAHDEALFEHYMQAQLAFVDAATGRRTPVGKPGMISSSSVSPNGQYLLVEKVKRPFSRLLTRGEFPSDVEIWTRTGEMARTIADVPMGDTVPINGVMTGPRSYRWIPLEPATVMWVEALDKGDIRNDVPNRDRIVMLKAPFTSEPAEVARTQFRYGGASWTDDGTILLSENDRKTRKTRTWLLNSAWGEPRKLWDRRQQDAYSNPGAPLPRPTRSTILQHGDSIYLSGSGASKDGDRPFLDRLNLKTLQVERLFRSDDKSFETVVGLLTDDGKKMMTRAETRTEPPNYFIRDLPGATRTAITAFKDPHPQITAAERMLVTYQRKDGVGLNGTIYLPPGFKKGERVPMLMWAYPREFVDADAASQISGSPNRFTSVSGSSHLLLLAHGYAIFDGPTMPIVGPGETANDSYVDQLVSSAEAAVNKAVDLGIADRRRIGVGGHSYGAFMTANLLAHSNLFAAGVARSGAYNRTLTPFGFQAETRTYWEVPEIYQRMSPFNYANKINEPILMIHGEADNNSGTFPIQSERLYMALKGHGATVRYITLPGEAHGYAARESNMHVVAETVNWLDKYVKNAGARHTTASDK